MPLAEMVQVYSGKVSLGNMGVNGYSCVKSIKTRLGKGVYKYDDKPKRSYITDLMKDEKNKPAPGKYSKILNWRTDKVG